MIAVIFDMLSNSCSIDIILFMLHGEYDLLCQCESQDAVILSAPINIKKLAYYYYLQVDETTYSYVFQLTQNTWIREYFDY